MSETQVNLHIPVGINYECTGCGKCCGGWAVPLTDEDYDRIAPTNWGARADKFKGKDLFRPLKPYEMVNVPYTHAIKHGEDGHCPFLVDNLCFIHKEDGSKAKPSICQLFPYCFNETPSGVYATVSFLSMGAIHNSGRALAEQREYLEQKYQDFQALFPNHHPNWDKLQLAVGKPLTWERYLEIETEILKVLQNEEIDFETRLKDCSSYLVGLARGAASSPAPVSSDHLNHLDRVLIANLHRLYFPTKSINRGEGDFSLNRFLIDASFGSVLTGLKIALPGRSYSLGDLESIKWPYEDKEVQNLLYRYFYSRIFAKLYFGAGYGQLSLITGFHHLVFVYTLVKWHAKALAKMRGVNEVGYLDVIASIRQLEKRMGETALGGYAAATLELLLFSASRIARVLKNSH